MNVSADFPFGRLLDATPDAIVVVNRQGEIVLVNAQSEVLFGYAREELIGQRMEILLPRRFHGSHVNHRDDFFEHPLSRPMGSGLDLWALRRDTTEFPVEISISPVEINGQMLVVSAIRDITERREVQEALRRAREEAVSANEAKSEFLSRMSHELRTPLNAVLGFAQLLELDPLSPSQEQRVQRILKAGRHLLDLINEVLDIARIEAGKLQLSPEPVRLLDAIREVLDIIRPLANERSISLFLEHGEAIEQYVTADRQRLKQVLLNLMSNAVKYNHEAGSITIACGSSSDGRLCLTVQDTGAGIPADRLSELFSPFNRLGAEASGVEGTGLGLALSKGLMEAMGGTIAVQSAPGAGSAFTLTLKPAEDPVLRAVSALPSTVPQTPAPAHERLILYVEDNLPNLELIEQILARWPTVRLLPAMQGRLGLDLARKHHPDLILLDIHLPDLPGNEVLRLLKEDAATRDIPVVVVSADATRGQIERLKELGAAVYLTKPIDVPRFLQVVRDMLEGVN